MALHDHIQNGPLNHRARSALLRLTRAATDAHGLDRSDALINALEEATTVLQLLGVAVPGNGAAAAPATVATRMMPFVVVSNDRIPVRSALPSTRAFIERPITASAASV